MMHTTRTCKAENGKPVGDAGPFIIASDEGWAGGGGQAYRRTASLGLQVQEGALEICSINLSVIYTTRPPTNLAN